MNWTLGLVGAGILAVLVWGNVFFYNKFDNERANSQKLELSLTTTQLEFKHVLEKQAENDAKVKDYQDELQKVAAQRDSYWRKVQEAMKKDAEFKTWSDTKLPAFVRGSIGYQWMRGEGSNSPASGGK